MGDFIADSSIKAQTWASVVKDTTNQNKAVVSAQVRQTLKLYLLDSLENWQGREKGNGDSRTWDDPHSSSHRINLGEEDLGASNPGWGGKTSCG